MNIKIIVAVLMAVFLLCGCATSKYQVQQEGEKIWTPEKVKSENYNVEVEKQ